jgi:hypothetical protein
MMTVQYEAKRNGEHRFWVGRHGPYSIRIDANRPGSLPLDDHPRRSVRRKRRGRRSRPGRQRCGHRPG